MATPNIKEEIRKLVELQQNDSQIFALVKEKNNVPRILESLQGEFEEKKAKLKALEDMKQKLLLKQKDKEGELATKEEGIKKAQSQLGQLKTNKEYQAKLTEIEGFKADKSLIEEEILKLMDEIDTARADAETEKKNMDVEEKNYCEKKSSITERLKTIDAQLQAIQGKRKILADSIDKQIFRQYEHILNGKEGLALVKVDVDSCAGCHMRVPHQVINEIKMYNRLITCGMCARILYLEDDILS